MLAPGVLALFVEIICILWPSLFVFFHFLFFPFLFLYLIS